MSPDPTPPTEEQVQERIKAALKIALNLTRAVQSISDTCDCPRCQRRREAERVDRDLAAMKAEAALRAGLPDPSDPPQDPPDAPIPGSIGEWLKTMGYHLADIQAKIDLETMVLREANRAAALGEEPSTPTEHRFGIMATSEIDEIRKAIEAAGLTKSTEVGKRLFAADLALGNARHDLMSYASNPIPGCQCTQCSDLRAQREAKRQAPEPTYPPAMARIFDDVHAERQAQDLEHGPPAERDYDLRDWAGVVAEEAGEAIAVTNDLKLGVIRTTFARARLREELIQTAASAVAAIEAIDAELRSVGDSETP